MSDAGGQITHLGVLYQDKIAALYLGRMVDPRATTLPASEQVVEVRGENPSAEVDDITVLFTDKHTEYMQAKTALDKSGKAWQKLWNHFYHQHRKSDFSLKDKLIILMGDFANWYKALKELCSKSNSSTNTIEWRKRCSEEQLELAEKILNQLQTVDHGFGWDDLKSLLQQVELRFIENEAIERDHLIYWIPDSNRPLKGLFDQLLSLVLKASSEGHVFHCKNLIATLEEAGIHIKPLGEQPELLPSLPEQGSLPEPGPQLPGWRLDFNRNTNFTGREQDLQALAEALLYTPAGNPSLGIVEAVAATGMGGLGKTQLAVEFCYRYGRFTHGVHWLKADAALVGAEIAECGRRMGLSGFPETLPDQVERTLQEWQSRPNRLVVLDNLEDLKVLEEWLPRLNGLKVLLTARRGKFPSGLPLKEHPLGLLSREECRALLRTLAPRLKGTPDSEIERLADEKLGRLPLAVDIAGRYLDEQESLTIQDYLKQLNQSGVLDNPAFKAWIEHNPTRHSTSLAQTFLVSWRALQGGSEAEALARRVFLASGYCAANTPIPPELLERACLEQGQDQALLGKALRRLVELGLLEASPGGALLHPLLAEFARLEERQVEEDLQAALVEAIEGWKKKLDDSGYWIGFGTLRPHMAAAISHFEDRENKARLMNNLGSSLFNMGDLAGARPYHENALNIRKEVLGEKHPDTANSLNNLGSLLQAMGDLAGAKPYLEQALAIIRELLGDKHPHSALCLNNLGGLLYSMGDLEGAKPYIDESLAIRRAVLGSKHPDTANSLNNLGGLLYSMGDLAGAKPYYEQSLAIRRAVLGDKHPDTANSLNNLGGLLYSMGDLEGAKPYYEQALVICREVLGNKHPNTATSLNNLGYLLRALGDLAGAKPYYEQALAINREVLGEKHPDTAASLNNLGGLHAYLEEWERAVEYMDQALGIRLEVLGGDHPDTAQTLISLVNMNLAQGDQPGAQKYFNQIMEITQGRQYPDWHPFAAFLRRHKEGG